MKRTILITVAAASVMLAAGLANANTVASSAIYFEGKLIDNGGGVYTGTIAATQGTYYMPGGPGEAIWDQGGFDVYAKNGAMAYVSGYNPTHNVISDHDAYKKGDGWGTYYDPDCQDWYNYQLTLTAGNWYLEYKGSADPDPANAIARPMSGAMNWTTMYASEDDTGSYLPGKGTPALPGSAAANGGGAGYWDMDWSWGSEAIPLQFPGFSVSVELLPGDSDPVYRVILTPVPAPGAVLLGLTGLGTVAWIKRRLS